MVTEILDEYTNIDVWNFMKAKGLNNAHMDTSQASATATGITARTYLSQPTPLRNAMEIWGFATYAWLKVLPRLVAVSSVEQDTADGYFALTYTQPQPPATNATTDAVTSGNLEFRNQPHVGYVVDSVSIAQPATQGVEVSGLTRSLQKFTKFDQPLRIALSQLEIYLNLQNLENAGSVDFRFQCDVFFRFVSVSDAEYSALVALATGTAVLTEVLIA